MFAGESFWMPACASPPAPPPVVPASPPMAPLCHHGATPAGSGNGVTATSTFQDPNRPLWPPPPPSPAPPPPPWMPASLPKAFCHAGCPQSLGDVTPLPEAARNVNSAHDLHQYTCDAAEGQPMYDANTLDEARWYRFTGAAGYRMPNVAPGSRACGTDLTGWLATPPPSMGQPPTPGTVCFDRDEAPFQDCYL